MKKAVITGDIINSTNMSDDVRIALSKNIATLLKELEETHKTQSELYRGDSFQCLVKKPEDALTVALLLKTRIRSFHPKLTKGKKKKTAKGNKNALWSNDIFDARIAIGLGDTKTVRKSLGTSSGEAFLLSGHLLDDLKETKRTFGITTLDKYRDELATESILLDTLVSQATMLQSEVIHLKLKYYSEIEIAKKLGIGQSAVNHRSTLGNWNAIHSMVERFEEMYKHE